MQCENVLVAGVEPEVLAVNHQGFFHGTINGYGGYVGEAAALRAHQQIKAPAQFAIFVEWMVKFLEMLQYRIFEAQRSSARCNFSRSSSKR